MWGIHITRPKYELQPLFYTGWEDAASDAGCGGAPLAPSSPLRLRQPDALVRHERQQPRRHRSPRPAFPRRCHTAVSHTNLFYF